MDLYLLCLIVGGSLFLLSLLGGHDAALGGHHLDFGHPGSGHPETGDIASWFSLRALISFVAFFGLAGVLGRLAGVEEPVRLVMSLVAGALMGFLTAWRFRLARARGEVNSGHGKLAGRTGRVLVPPAAPRVGKVEVTVAGQIEQLQAVSTDTLKPGDRIIVIGEERGVLDVKFWDGE